MMSTDVGLLAGHLPELRLKEQAAEVVRVGGGPPGARASPVQGLAGWLVACLSGRLGGLAGASW